MKTRRQIFGQLGEDLAARHLEEQGIRILERNVREKSGEIDLVALDGDLVLFVEVRARRGDLFGSAVESIGPRKARRMVASAFQYLVQREWTERDWRIDLVAVSFSARGELLDVEHIAGAIEQ